MTHELSNTPREDSDFDEIPEDSEKPGLAGEIVDWIRRDNIQSVTADTVKAEFTGGDVTEQDVHIAMLDIIIAARTIKGVL